MKGRRWVAVLALAVGVAACAADDPLSGESAPPPTGLCEDTAAVDDAVASLLSGVDEERFTYDVGYEADAGTVMRLLRRPETELSVEWRSAFDQVWMHFERYWSAAVPQGIAHEHQSVVRNLTAADPGHRRALVQAAGILDSTCSGTPPEISSGSNCGDRGPDANLIGCDLSGADLSHLDLRNALLQLADLSDADLSDTNLAGADLAAAELFDTTFTDAILDRTNLRFTRLDRADLAGASLTGATLLTATLPSDLSGLALDRVRFGVREHTDADFSHSTLRGAVFTHDDLSGSVFTGADLTDVLMVDVKLIEASLTDVPASRARLAGADLTDAIADGIDLTAANLAGTKLRGASLQGATFVNAVLDHADFTGADLTGADFTNAQWDTTTCPDGSLSDDSPDQSCPLPSGASASG